MYGIVPVFQVTTTDSGVQVTVPLPVSELAVRLTNLGCSQSRRPAPSFDPLNMHSSSARVRSPYRETQQLTMLLATPSGSGPID